LLHNRFRHPEVGSGPELLSTALSQPDEVYRNGRGAVHVLKRVGWMRVEPQQRNAHPTEEQSGSMNVPTSVAERVNFYPVKRKRFNV